VRNVDKMLMCVNQCTDEMLIHVNQCNGTLTCNAEPNVIYICDMVIYICMNIYVMW
jgi:hypothetical protein